MQKRDLTRGSIVGNLLHMAIPTMIGFMAHTLYDLVDMMWVGRLSSEAVAGVTIFVTLYWLAFVLNSIVGMSSVSLISQNYGSGNIDKTKRVIEQTIVFKALLAVISATIMLVLLRPLLGLFTDDLAVLDNALAYGRLRLFFLPIMFSSLTVTTALRNTGDSKRAMYIMMLSAAMNIILDPILIFDRVPGLGIPGFGLGIFGAALATEISATCAFLFGFWMLFSGRSFVQPRLKGLLRLDWEIDRQLITVGAPSGVEVLLRNLASAFVLSFVSVYGTIAVAAIGICQRLTSFAFMPLEGLMTGSSTVVGQNLGVNNVQRAEQTAKAAALIGCVAMVVLNLIVFLFPRQILSLFTTDPEVLRLGTTVLYFMMPGMILLGVAFGFGSLFSGSGYNLPFMVSGMVARWVVQLPYLLVTVSWLKLPFVFAVGGYVLAEVAELAIIMVFYLKGRWRTWRVVEHVMEETAELEQAAAVN